MRFIQRLLMITLLTLSSKWLYSYSPIDEIKSITYLSSEDTLLPLSEGAFLRKGANFYLFESGKIPLRDNLLFNYTFRQDINSYHKKAQIHKLYLSYHNDIFSLILGKNTQIIGVSQNSIILSENPPPFPMLYISNLKPLRFLGNWRFELFHGWLDEKRQDISNPRVIIIRAQHMGEGLISFGLTRYSQYGGKGREGYKLWEYLRMLFGDEENTSNSKYDTDGYFGYDITLDISRYFNKTDSFKVYFQQIATDIVAPWQKEDKGKFSFPFIVKLQANSYQAGVEVKKGFSTCRLEFTKINDLFYHHHLYHKEGYSYKGFFLAEPYGNNLRHIYFNHQLKKDENTTIQYEIGYLKRPASKNTRTTYTTTMERYYLNLQLSKGKNTLTLTPLLKIAYSHNYDLNPLPKITYQIIPSNKLLLILSLSLQWRI